MMDYKKKLDHESLDEYHARLKRVDKGLKNYLKGKYASGEFAGQPVASHKPLPIIRKQLRPKR